MPRYEYNGAEELVFPTLGIIVKNGDVFDGPENLSISGVSLVGKAKKTTTDLNDVSNVEEVAAADEAAGASAEPAN